MRDVLAALPMIEDESQAFQPHDRSALTLVCQITRPNCGESPPPISSQSSKVSRGMHPTLSRPVSPVPDPERRDIQTFESNPLHTGDALVRIACRSPAPLGDVADDETCAGSVHVAHGS